MLLTGGYCFEAPLKIPRQLCECRSLKINAKQRGSQSTSRLAQCFHPRLIFAHQTQHQRQEAQARPSTINYDDAITMVSAQLVQSTVDPIDHLPHHCPPPVSCNSPVNQITKEPLPLPSPSLKPKLTFHPSSYRSATQPPRSNPPSPPALAAPTSASPSKTHVKPPRRSMAGSCSAR